MRWVIEYIMTNTNPYVCSENNLNAPECTSIPYENSEESIEMYGDYDTTQGFDHTLLTDVQSDYHKYLKEVHYKPQEKTGTKSFPKWKKKITKEQHEQYQNMHLEHKKHHPKKDHPKKEHNMTSSLLHKAQASYTQGMSEYKKFYERFNKDAWLESRRIHKIMEPEKKDILTAEFRKKYSNNSDQFAYLQTEGENNECPKMNYEKMIKCRDMWYSDMANDKNEQHKVDILKGEEQSKLKKEADAAKHQENSRAARDP